MEAHFAEAGQVASRVLDLKRDRPSNSRERLLDMTARIRRVLPEGGHLPADMWQRRHAFVIFLLWAHAAVIPVFAMVMGSSIDHGLFEAMPAVIVAFLAGRERLKPPIRAAFASFGLLSCSAVMVHLSGGYIEFHFHYFIMLSIIALYQDWTAFLLAIAYVVVQHGVIGVLDPHSVYNHASAIGHPWRWAGIHGAFVLGASIANVVAWRLIEDGYKREQALARAKHEAEQASRAKSEFLSRMSHELRTPLNAIIGFTELIRDGKAGPVHEQQDEFLTDILTSSHHLLELINDVLDLSKVEAGKLGFHPEPCDLAQILAEVAGIVDPLASRKQIRMVSYIDPSLGRIVLDPIRLKQVLYNYLSNAIKFTESQGTVAIRFRPEDEQHFRLEVQDTGIGIRPRDLARLFMEFEQIEAGNPRNVQGTGLGLRLTKRMVEAQGGQVGVESTFGKGSTFYAVLPRQMRAEKMDHAGVPAGSSATSLTGVATSASRPHTNQK
jgi:signal transduction histidine kinase